MKKILLLLLAALMFAACGSNETKSNDKVTDAPSEVSVENLVEVSIPVGGMTCEGCEKAVKKSIGSLEGIADVSASHVDSVAVVKYDDSQADVEAIKAKIEEAGYELL